MAEQAIESKPKKKRRTAEYENIARRNPMSRAALALVDQAVNSNVLAADRLRDALNQKDLAEIRRLLALVLDHIHAANHDLREVHYCGK